MNPINPLGWRVWLFAALCWAVILLVFWLVLR